MLSDVPGYSVKVPTLPRKTGALSEIRQVRREARFG